MKKKIFSKSISWFLVLLMIFGGVGILPEIVATEITAQAAFISGNGWMEICKPYQYNDVTEYLRTSENTFNVAGNEYNEGMVFYAWYSTGKAQTLWNLDGKYDSFSFTVGKVDGTTAADATIDVYIDGVLSEKLSIPASSSGKKFNLELNGAKQLRFVFYHTGHYYNVYYALFNGKWVSNGTSGSQIKASQWLYKCSPYESQNTETARKADNKSFIMGGKSYPESLKFYLWNGTYSSSSAKFNLNGRYDTFNFTIGHVDGTTRAPFTLKILLDGELSRTITVSADDLPKTFSVSLNKADQLILNSYSSAESNVYNINYAIAEANFIKNEPVSISDCQVSFDEQKVYYTGKAVEPDVTITDEYYTLVRDVDYTVTYKNNIEVGSASVVINGIGDYTGKAVKKFSIYTDYPSKIVLSSSEIIAKENSEYDLYAVLSPENTKYIDNSSITWKSSDSGIAKYDASTKKVLTYKAGTATITATTANGKKALCKITVKAPELKNTSVITSASVDLGNYININASATGGTGDYTYAVWYKRSSDSSWTTKQKYSTNATIKIKPESTGKYDISVKVKNSSGTIVKKAFTVNVFAPLKNTTTVSSSSIGYGGTFTVKAKATGGLGEYTYAVYYKKASATKWTTAQNYSSTKTVTIKPKYAEEYDVSVKVKDSSGVVAKKTFKIKVTKPTNTSKVASTTITLGNTIDITCSATGGSGFYQYAVYYKKSSDTSWKTKQSYSSNTNVSIKPASKTKYDVSVKVKDSLGNVSKKAFTITVK